MNEYIFEKVKSSSLHVGRTVRFEEHREKINEFANNGYRYIGWVPTEMDGFGHIKEIDLIFEKIEQ